MSVDQALPPSEYSFEPRREGGGLGERLEAVRRRFWPMVLVGTFVVWGRGCGRAFSGRPLIGSAGTILIEQQEVPEDFVQSAVSSYADQRVQMIGQRVMTSTNLLGIIRKFGLYPVESKNSRARSC